MRYIVRPISDPTWLGSMGKEPTRFQASWSSTLELLGREIDYLKGRDVVIEVDVTEGDLKLNSELRANARPSSSAVVVAFESRHGPLLYRCDRFYTNWHHQGPEWQHNVRAIALTLEALRAVDRYGATETGQQYTGFKALPAGRAMPASHMTSNDAYALLEQIAIGDDDERRVRTIQRMRDSADLLRDVFREARKVTHPDRRGSDHTAWNQVEEAGKVLGLVR
jgi:hypothetical protein